SFLADAIATCLPRGAAPPRFGEAALAALRSHRWPGNVRELMNAVQRAVIVGGAETIEPHHLGLGLAATVAALAAAVPAATAEPDYESAKRDVIERFQREFVQRALERTGGNVSEAAERCGLTRAALQRIMRALEIEREAFLRGKSAAQPA
ncbi:MAG: hypothetical protein FJ293_15335, partial [Planctomycetes bacterium]|nr:hypothetical protein [Planctomycetota bacterium]